MGNKQLHVEPSEKFLIVGYPKEDQSELMKKSSKTREASYKWSTIKYSSINVGPPENFL